MAISSRWLQWRLHPRIVAGALTSIILWHLFLFRKDYYSAAYERFLPPPPIEPQPSCASLEGLQDIFLVVRTGANEAPERLPAHFNTTLRCFPDHAYGIWSDFEEDIGGHHVGNALDEIDPSIVTSHPDFAYYRRLQQQGRDAFTAEELAGWAVAPNTAGGRDSPGWKLDKWKFLPMADKAYRQRPEAKWFIFMEGDTYISWRNLLQWLSQIDASKPYYLGDQMQIGDVVFAYGGSGFVMSNPAMKALVERHASNPGVYEEFTGNHWAGDCILGKTLQDAGVRLSWQRPNLFGGRPSDMAYSETFGPSNHRVWCYYATTYHHLSPLDINEVFTLEQKWNREHTTFMRHRDVFHSLVLPKISARVDDWENISTDNGGSKGTFEDCRDACQDKPECIQFVFHADAQTCKTSRTIRLGHKRLPDAQSGGKVASGWMMDRVDMFIKAMDAECDNDEVDWMLPD